MNNVESVTELLMINMPGDDGLLKSVKSAEYCRNEKELFTNT